MQSTWLLSAVVLHELVTIAVASCPGSAPPGSFCSNNATVSCPASFFCAGGVSLPTPCIPSFVCPSTGFAFAPTCNWTVGTFAGNTSAVIGSSDGIGPHVYFNNPRGLVVSTDGSGTVFVADAANQLIRGVNSTGGTYVVAGSGTLGSNTGPASSAQFNGPWSVSVSSNGSVLVADTHNSLIRIVSGGIVGPLAGSTASGYLDGVGTNAKFNTINGIATGPDGTIVVADTLNCNIRSISMPSITVTTLAGSTACGFADGTLAGAQFNWPYGVGVSGNASRSVVAVADYNNNRIRAVSSISGLVKSVAGSGTAGFADGVGALASFSGPTQVVFDAGSNSTLFVADMTNNRIRMIILDANLVGTVTTIAGSGVGTFVDGVGSLATMRYPYGVAIAPGHGLFVGATSNNAIRSITCNNSLFSLSASVTASVTVTPSPTGTASISSTRTHSSTASVTTSQTRTTSATSSSSCLRATGASRR